MEKRSEGSMPPSRSVRPNSLVSLVQGLGIKVPTDYASGKHDKADSASLSVSADLANASARLSVGSPKSFHSPRLKSPRSSSPVTTRVLSTAKIVGGVSPNPRPATTQKPAVVKQRSKTDLSASTPKNYPPALPVKKQQSATPKAASGVKTLSTSASQPIKSVAPPILRKKDTPMVPDAPAPATSLSPQAQRELEASKNMVSPRIEFDATRPATAPQRSDPKPKVVSRSKAKETKNKVLQSLVTKVGDTAEPGDQGKSKAEIIYRKHLYQTFRGLKMARSLPLADPIQIQAKRVVLMKPPGKYRRKTAIFDLDETLVHCLDRTEPAVPDVVLPIRFPNGEIVHANIKLRPYCLECLTQISEDFELIVFTASQRSYADAVLNYLDPGRTLIHHRLYRDSCVVSDKVHIKDLRVLANRSLKDVVLVDNASYSFGYQIDNGIPIVSWHYDPDDKELMYLTEYLKGLLNADDVREVNQATFHLATFYNDYSDEFLPKTVPTGKKGKT